MKTAFPLLCLLSCTPTVTVDVTAPRLAETNPIDGAVDVPPTTAIQACFSAPLNPATVTASGVELARQDGHGHATLALSVVLDPSATCLQILPGPTLAPSSHYQVTLKKTLLGANGVAIGDSRVTSAYVFGFTTAGAPATATLLVPSDGMLSAPLDLSTVVIAFSAPVRLGDDGGPFLALPGGGPSTLSSDGRLATAPFAGAAPGVSVSVTLDPSLTDPSGQPPETGGPLGFTLGQCAEGSAPGVGAAAVVAQDVDAWLEFAVDRPGLCGAAVSDPGSSAAGPVRLTGPRCTAAYDPCLLGSACVCDVPIAALGPGDLLQVVPTLLGFDGQLGAGPVATFQTALPLPSIALTEIFPGPKTAAFVELQNRGSAPFDLQGIYLADCELSIGCSALKSAPLPFGPAGGVGSTTLQPDAYALLVDPTFDPTAASVPDDVLLLTPLDGKPLLHLSSTEAQSLALLSSQAQAPVSIFDGAVLPKKPYSLERVDPGVRDAIAGNWALSRVSGGTPGACNSVTPGSACDP